MRDVQQAHGEEKVDVELRREVGGHLFTATVRGLKCTTCGETYTEGIDGERFDLAVARALSAAEPSGEAFKFLRKMAGLRAADLAELLGVTGDTISRWETGKHSIDRGAFALLGLLVNDQAIGSKATLDALRAVATAKPLRKRVALKLAS